MEENTHAHTHTHTHTHTHIHTYTHITVSQKRTKGKANCVRTCSTVAIVDTNERLNSCKRIISASEYNQSVSEYVNSSDIIFHIRILHLYAHLLIHSYTHALHSYLTCDDPRFSFVSRACNKCYESCHFSWLGSSVHSYSLSHLQVLEAESMSV